MKSEWRDGERIRSVEVIAQGEGRWSVVIDDVPIDIHVAAGQDGHMTLSANGHTSTAIVSVAGDRRFVWFDRLDFVLERATRVSGRKRGATGGGLEAPMPGVVTKVLVAAGDAVVKGQPLVALEAMKMEHMIRSPRDGHVKAVMVEQGALVDGGAQVIELEENEGT